MRKLIIASFICGAASVAVAHATDNSAQIGGFIAPSCSVTGVDVRLDFASVTAGQTVTDDTVTIQCNDVDGANLSMNSAEGGLEHDDDEDFEVEYTAVLTNEVIGGNTLTLDTSPAFNNDVTAETQLGSSIELADGRTGSLTVTLDTSGTYAGGYSDTLQITIEANI